ncbi:flagellar protein FliO/FliZ [Kushneria sinocarnis]|uniref:Flagellar protein n=1 Tax=Kushneria sinocarnis TaxID=595502 RepID=A0A420WXZ5_9GAMM|nr:flagellar biosynthetic protein FliO [Kushneria sinocarnis]RKR06094.1 flagellar protein FliO/FliZ [Kushneria sinocarnis]
MSTQHPDTLLPEASLNSEALHTAATLQTTQAPAGGSGYLQGSDADMAAAGMGKTMIGLVVVLAIIGLCAWAIRRLGRGRLMGSQRQLRVIASQNLGQRERVVMVEVEDTWLVLGVAPGSVRTLHTLPARSAETPGEDSAAPGLGESFRRVLAQRFDRRDRNS